MTPHTPPIGSDIKATTGATLPKTKCPTHYGVIDMVTPPWLPARSGSRRGYCDTGNGFNIENSVVIPTWWAKPDKTEINWDALHVAAKAYSRNAIVGVDIEAPWQPDIRKTDFAYAMESRKIIARVLAEMNAVRPDLIVGCYATIPNLYWESLNAGQLEKWRDAAAFCQPIIDASDIVMPVSYLHYDRDDENDDIDIASDAINIDNEVGEAIKLANGKPVVPWVSAKIYDGSMTKSRDVSPARWKHAMERIKSMGCAGVAMWGFNNGLNPGIHESILLDEAIKIWNPKAAA